jgi:hypothetical protein
MADTHLSAFELDAASLSSASPAASEHLVSCERCQAAVAQREQSVPLPQWVRELPPRGRAAWRLGGWTLWVPVAVAATVALVVAYPKTRPDEVRVKGAPVLSVFIKRGDEVKRWDGAERVRAGDRLQLKVSAEGYRQLRVLDGDEPLYDGPVPRDGELLDESWRVDDAQAPLVLGIVVSREHLSTDEARAAVAGKERSERAWSTVLTFTR